MVCNNIIIYIVIIGVTCSILNRSFICISPAGPASYTNWKDILGEHLSENSSSLNGLYWVPLKGEPANQNTCGMNHQSGAIHTTSHLPTTSILE